MTSRAKILLNFTRNYSFPPKRWYPDSVKYGKVMYFPRNKEQHQDPPITPSKLLLVQRVKPFKGNPWWEKDILKELGLGEDVKSSKFAIVKNIPEVCSRLWRVKHLVKITPIKLPEKLPDADDVNGTYLHENGTFYVTPRIDPERLEATEKFINSSKKFTTDEIQHKIRLQWLSGTIMQ